VTRAGLAFFGSGFLAALAGGWIVFPSLLYERSEQPMAFSHEAHAGESLGMACEDCHAFRQDGRFSGIPAVAKCAECHQEAIGTTPEEKKLVEEFVSKGREIPWLVYSRQPDNTWFPHAIHVKLAGLACDACHGPHGKGAALRPFERNRISGYSRDIWGPSIARAGLEPWQGHKMTDCSECHHERGIEESCLDCHR